MLGRINNAWLRAYNGFGPKIVHEVAVPPDPEGRPGARLLAASRPLHLGRQTDDGHREEFAVLVGPNGSTLQSVSFAQTNAPESPLDSAWFTIIEVGRMGASLIEGVFEDEVAGCGAWRYVLQLRSFRLTEWKFEHAGWLYGVGIVASPRDNEAAVLEFARRSLATWRWTEPPTTAQVSTTR